ncbi:OLC1v1015363C2 [Oldenlandia corymbosa var. corymbosa]|nr:OLC1v1015363C2 [Oldenlandia corymbosa var. corymbosa]
MDRKSPDPYPISATDRESESRPVSSSSDEGESLDLSDYGCSVEDYYPHLNEGAKLLNPKSIDEDLFFNLLRSRRFLGDKGSLAFGIIMRDEVLVAFNHSKPVCRTHRDLNVVGPRAFAAISGGTVRACRRLLQQLREKCMEHGEYNSGASVEKATQLMSELVKGSRFVGLIAGWDDPTDLPALYLVDGLGARIKGEKILATGFSYTSIYAAMDLEGLVEHLNEDHLNYILDSPFDEKIYSTWSGWSRGEVGKLAIRQLCMTACNAPYSGKYASVYSVGRYGVNQLDFNKSVKRLAREHKLLVSICRPGRGVHPGIYAYKYADDSGGDENSAEDSEDITNEDIAKDRAEKKKLVNLF